MILASQSFYEHLFQFTLTVNKTTTQKNLASLCGDVFSIPYKTPDRCI